MKLLSEQNDEFVSLQLTNAEIRGLYSCLSAVFEQFEDIDPAILRLEKLEVKQLLNDIVQVL